MNNPFLRWKDRFHRGRFAKESKFRLFLLRPTFDRLKRVSKSKPEEENPPATEVQILEFVREVISSPDSDRDWYIKRGYLTKNKEKEITAAYTSNPKNRGGLVFLFPGVEEFTGELDKDHIPLIMEYVDDIPSRWIESDEAPISIELYEIPNISPESVPKTSSYFVDINDGDLRESKIFPTDVLLKNDKDKDSDIRRTLQTLRRLLAEIRVTDRGGEPSEEQAKAMNKFDLGTNPILNITGRPGTGKTTVAQIAAAEAALQPASGRARKSDRKVMYLTTTGNLKSEAYEEIVAIISSVYGRPDWEQDAMNMIDVITRDNLIAELPQISPRLDSRRVREILDEMKSDELESIQKWWGPDKSDELDELAGELFRVIQNFVYGVFGSISKFIQWFENAPRRSGFKPSDQKGWSKVFGSERKWNLVDPSDEFLPTGRDQFPLFRVWNPYGTDDFDKLTNKQLKEGYEKIKSLKKLLEMDDFSSKLFDESLSGNWTYASVLDYLSSVADDKTAKFRTDIWSKFRNSYDVIIIDESQDFTIRELACVLRVFSHRARNKITRQSAFSFVCAGDPLQTIEGSIFNAKHSHINAVYEDWKQYLSDSGADKGLRDPDHTELKANYRNAEPIVMHALNPIISKMNEYDRRTISQQRPAFNRPGLIRRGSSDDFQGSEPENIAKMAANRLHDQLSKSLSSKENESLTLNPTTALILPREKFSTLERLKDCLTQNGIWDYAKSDQQSGETIGSIIEELLDVLDEDGNPTGEKEEDDGIRYRQTLNDSGIYDIAGIKGRTVQLAIAMNFANKAVSDVKQGNESRSLLSLSHLLVASSRPQFALLLHDPETKTGDLESLNIKLKEEMKFEDIKRIVADSTVDYNPSEYFSRAMDSAFLNARRSGQMGEKGDKLYWSIAVKAAKESARGKEFVDFCKQIHEYYEDNSTIKIIEMLDEGMNDTKIENLRKSANEIDQASCWVIGGETTRDKLLTFMRWKVFVEDGDRLSGINSESLSNWVEWAKQRASTIHTGKILGISDDDYTSWNFSPFYFQKPPISEEKSYKSRPKRARRDDCSFSCEVPHRWIFGDMVMESVYTTPYVLLKERIEQLRPSNTPQKEKTWRNWFTIRWFLTSSQLDQEVHRNDEFRDDLLIIAKEAIDDDMGAEVIEWILGSLEPLGLEKDRLDKSLFRELVHWCSGNDGEKFREKFIQAMTDYLVEIIESNPDSWETEKNVLKIARLFCSEHKQVRSEFDPNENLRHFWFEVTNSDRFVSAVNNWYLDMLTGTKQIVPSDLEQFVIRLSNSHTIFTISNRRENEDKQIAESTLLRRISLMIDLLYSYQMRNETHFSFRSRISQDYLWNDFEHESEKKFVIKLLSEWMNLAPGGELGKLRKQRSRTDYAFISNLLHPVDPNGNLSEYLGNNEIRKYIRSLRNFGLIQSNYYFENLYIESVKRGQMSNISKDPILKFLTGLIVRKKENVTDERLRLLNWESIDILNSLQSKKWAKRWDETGLYREGINFWNYIDDEKFSAALKRVIMSKLRSAEGCRYRELEHQPTIFDKIYYFSHEGSDPILSKFARVPMPSINHNGVVNPFCNSNPGIVAYTTTTPENEPYELEKLEMIRGEFRRSGCYREAAAIDIVLSILGHRNAKEMIAMALEERIGIFHDQVTVTGRWAKKDRTIKKAQEDSILQSSLTWMLSLQSRENSLVPLYSNPIGIKKYGRSGPSAHDSLNLLPRNVRDTEIARLLNNSDKRRSVKPDEINLIDELINFKEIPGKDIDQEKCFARLSQIVVNLLYSTRTLLPYILASNEVEQEEQISEIKWFELDHPGWPNMWEVGIEDIPRETLVSEIKKQDEWLYLLYENYMETGQIDTEAFIESLPTPNLKSIVEIYLGRAEVVEESEEVLQDVDNNSTDILDSETDEDSEDSETPILCDSCSKDLTLLLSLATLNFCPDCGNKL